MRALKRGSAFMGDVKKDVDAMIRMRASGEDSLRIAFDLNNTVIKLFEQRIKKQNPRISKSELRKKVAEDLFYGRKDNP